MLEWLNHAMEPIWPTMTQNLVNWTLALSNSTSKILFLGKTWPQNFKVLYLQWILVQRVIQGCWLWSIQMVVGISTSEYLFIHIFILNKPLWSSRTKSTQKSYFRDKVEENSCWFQNRSSWIPLCIKFHFRQNLIKTWPQRCPQKSILGRNLGKWKVLVLYFRSLYNNLLCFRS